MEPITLTIAVGGVVAMLAIGGISLRVFRRKNTESNGVLSETTAAKVAANPEAVSPGDHLTLVDLSDTFLVAAVATYREEDPEDRWYEFELRDELTGKVRYLSAERDDEDRWRWCVHEVLGESEVGKIPELAEVTYTEGKPPKHPFTVRGALWQRAHDSYHYRVLVTDRRLDRPEPASYEARISDYVPQGGGPHELSVELWKGGRCVSIGRLVSDRVLKS